MTVVCVVQQMDARASRSGLGLRVECAPVDLPPIGDRVEPDALREWSDDGLDALGAELQSTERATIAAMAPYEQHLREIRMRGTELATERRRRERAHSVAQRAGVREAAKSGGMPSLAVALASPEELFDPGTVLTDVHAFLNSGGEVGFGFATRPGTMTFTDGRQQRQARTWGEARELHASDGTRVPPVFRASVYTSRAAVWNESSRRPTWC